MWQRLRLVSMTLALLAVGTFSAEPADDIKPPSGYRQWFHVNTMIVDKGSPLFADLGGMHNVYVNSTGLAALKKGGPYPDKSTFVTDLHEFTMSDGSYVEGAQGTGHHGQGCEEVRIDRRLGISALGRRRSEKAASDGRRQAMLRMSSAEERPGLRLFHVHSLRRGA